MKFGVNHVRLALVIAIVAHLAFVYAVPNLLMGVAIKRLGEGGYNTWRVAERVGPDSRTIVRPSPDFAYSACPYDLDDGPIRIRVAPWGAYWSLSLYSANSDNYFVIDDREARNGAEIVLARHERDAPEGAAQIVVSPSRRGVALIRRLAPTRSAYEDAAEVAREDVCSTISG